MNTSCWLVFSLTSLWGADVPEDFRLPAAPGGYAKPTPAQAASGRDFTLREPTIATTYFYWYDDQTQAHIVDHDGTDALTDHPPTLRGFSYRNVAWHEQQLRDMMAAGIDVLLPVYWGVPGEPDSWSNQGIPPLVEARRRLIAQGAKPPAIGMFYDTSTLQHNGYRFHVDLTTSQGKQWFSGTVRDFFSLVPPADRATVAGRPLVFLYAPAFAQGLDGTLFADVRRRFRQQFGTDLFLVSAAGWPAGADASYEWGGALRPRFVDQTASIGPGYDHSAVPGRNPLVRQRQDGRFYRVAWERLLRIDPQQRPWLVHLETWNEFHEGTDICESREYGRQYLELTRHYAELFHARRQLRSDEGLVPPGEVSATPEIPQGIDVASHTDGDGPLEQVVVAGRRAWRTVRSSFSPTHRYLYVDVDDLFLFEGDVTVAVTVEYYDQGPREFGIQYDSCDPQLAGLRQQFREGPRLQPAGTNSWQVTTFTLPHARFGGRANGFDFRLHAVGGELSVARIIVRRLPVADNRDTPAPGR